MAHIGCESGLIIADARMRQWIKRSHCRIKDLDALRLAQRSSGPQAGGCGCDEPAGNLLAAAELQHTVAQLVVEGLGEPRTLLDVFRDNLTDDHLAALDKVTDPKDVWDLPGFDALGRMRVAQSEHSKTHVTLAGVLPIDMGSTSQSVSIYRDCNELPELEEAPESDPRPGPCVMTYGWHWWEVMLWRKAKAWTRIRCGGEPTKGTSISVFMSSGCSNPVSWAKAKVRNNESDVELSRSEWGGGTWGPSMCTNHNACIEPGNCLRIRRIDLSCCNFDYE